MARRRTIGWKGHLETLRLEAVPRPVGYASETKSGKLESMSLQVALFPFLFPGLCLEQFLGLLQLFSLFSGQVFAGPVDEILDHADP
jgi:hypothetical protein